MLFLKAPQPSQYGSFTSAHTDQVALFVYLFLGRSRLLPSRGIKEEAGTTKRTTRADRARGLQGGHLARTRLQSLAAPGASSIGRWGHELLLHVMQQHTKPTQNKTKSFPACKRILSTGLQRLELCIPAESKEADSQWL